MTRRLLEAIREEPGERNVQQLSEDLRLPVEKTRRQVDRLRQAGKLAPAAYRLASLLEAAEQKHSGVTIRFGRLQFDITYPVGGRAVPDTRAPVVIVGSLEREGGGYRMSRPEDLEVRIVAALQHDGPLRPGDLATAIHVDSHDGTFARACQWLIRQGIVLDWRAPYPVEG